MLRSKEEYNLNYFIKESQSFGWFTVAEAPFWSVFKWKSNDRATIYNRLTSLTTLDISGNLFCGCIPPEFCHSSRLQGLYLGNNQLSASGTIPGNLACLGSLLKLNLTGNKLYGSVPLSFANLNELTHLDLGNSELDGQLPSSLSQMLNLLGIYVQQNRLFGPIDELLSNSIAWRIETMNLSNNFFDGNLPKILGNLSYLTYLDLHGNKLICRRESSGAWEHDAT